MDFSNSKPLTQTPASGTDSPFQWENGCFYVLHWWIDSLGKLSVSYNTTESQRSEYQQQQF